MDLLSLCPFPIAALPWQPQPGEWNLTVCVKATFSLVHGQEAQLAAAQHALVDDTYWDNNPAASLYAPSDFVPYKPRVDVLLTGHAYAPGGAPVESLPVRLQVGPFGKALTLTGDRAWAQGRGGVRPGPTAPFRRMALRYERAALAGENAIGVDGAAHGVEPGRPLPNIVASGAQTPGFGPLPLLWRARRRKLPDAAVLWAYRVRLGAGTMPPGFDFDLFNAAPAEQQLDALPPRAAIVLENLSPHLPRLESRLPALAPRLFRMSRSTGRASPAALRADTLWIDADRALAVVSWRGFTPVAGPRDEEVGQLVVVVETEGEPVRSSDVERLVRAGSAHRGPPSIAVATASEAAPASAPAPAAPAPAAPAPAAPVPAPSRSFAADPDVTQAVRAGMLRAALPFQAELAGGPSPQRASSSDLAAPPVLPFRLAATASLSGAVLGAAASEAPVAIDEDATTRVSLKSLRTRTAPLAREEPPAPAPLAGEAPAPVPEAYPGHPAPPPLGASLFSASPPAALPAEPPEPPPLLGAPLFDASAPPSPATDPDAVAVERCAAIAAELAEKRAAPGDVLRMHGLTPEAWTAVEERWAKAIEADAKRGGGKLLGAYDAAYVAAVESFRGPVTAEEYGGLLQAMKAGKVNQALDGLRIQRAAMPRLMRVWIKKLAEDPQLFRKVQGVADTGSA